MGRKFGKFGESSAICQSTLVVTINKPLADLFIRQTFFHQILKKSKFAKLSTRQAFLLYSITNIMMRITINRRFKILYG